MKNLQHLSLIRNLRYRILLLCFAGLSGSVSAAEPGTFDLQRYQLAPADVIEVFVWKEEDLSRTVSVRPDGRLSYPLIGEVEAAGKTIEQMQQDLEKRIQAYIPSAVVSVVLNQVAGYRVYVLGEVNNPGEFSLNRYVTVAQALTLANGLTAFAHQNEIRIVRQQQGTEQSFSFNYKKFKRGKDLAKNIQLEAGDVVIVP
jgi:polysaccharide export outer membrane protein